SGLERTRSPAGKKGAPNSGWLKAWGCSPHLDQNKTPPASLGITRKHCLQMMPSDAGSNFRAHFPTFLNACKHCLRQFHGDVRRQGVSNADTQTEALGGPWPGDLGAGGTRTRGAIGRTRGTNSTEPW